jgi:hypothetical protein
MKLTKEQVAAVVTEASQKMSDPNYSAVMVGGFVQSQPQVAQFINAHDRELGGAEAIVNVIFHCALVGTAFQRAGGRLRTLSFEDLDRAAIGDALARLEKAQLPIHEFVQANIENAEAKRLVAMIALAIDGVA